jgi:para-nitrobenzyl esterase
MTPADIEVAARLQACVLRFVREGRPDDAAHWPAFTAERRRLAVFDSPFRMDSIKDTPRDRIWRLLEDKHSS